jgi:magnesium transporter
VWPSLSSVGRNPTFGEDAPVTVEAYLLEQDLGERLYGVERESEEHKREAEWSLPMNSSGERAQGTEPDHKALGTALKPERRNIQATLRQVRELLHKQEIIESLVSRQHAHRQDLVESLVARQHEVELSQKFRHLHPADIAFVLESLPREQRLRLWRLVPSELDGAVLLEASDAVREFLIADMDKGEILRAARGLDGDDIADLVPHLPSDLVPELLGSLTPEDRAEAHNALAFPEGTVGALMDFDMIPIRENKRLEVVLRYLRRFDRLPDHTNKLMVVDKGGMLTGVLFLQDLLVHDPDILVADIMEREPVHFRTDDDIEEVAGAFERYALVSAPVVNAHGQLVGRLTVDQVMEVALDAAQEDMLAQVGLQPEEDLFANVWRAARNRWPWLVINLVTAFMASRVIGVFEGTIEKVVALATLMPIIASIGGNTGNQAVALTVRGLALDQIDQRNVRHLMAKELGISAINGILWGSVMAAVTWLLYGQMLLGAIMTAAMLLNLLLAALVGVAIPLGLKYLGRDPAMGSSIILTFLTDAGGFFIFLGLAAALLPD